ncbi:MAG TPA: hypothetical protein VFQ67_09515 [Allosphingosinicella sp.]|jgi:hypothetical protein|nr:hypothetical protein [Allosphingosinicella sp.]
MEVVGSYREQGYAHLKGLLDPLIARALLRGLVRDLGRTVFPMTGKESRPGVLNRAALQVHGEQYEPLKFLLWGLTPLLTQLVGRELLPTYDLFRVYRAGDICRVHSDREACEHSLSLTLDYSDGIPWPLQIGRDPLPERQKRLTEDFGHEEHVSIGMEPGDAVLYRGTHRRHGRTEPNPNRWSAHLFLHWVERDGAYREHAPAAFADSTPVNFA